jgi:hypothetical protein
MRLVSLGRLGHCQFVCVSLDVPMAARLVVLCGGQATYSRLVSGVALAQWPRQYCTSGKLAGEGVELRGWRSCGLAAAAQQAAAVWRSLQQGTHRW